MPNAFGHMVYFSLDDRSDEAIDRLVAECNAYLADHPGTVYFGAGRLANTMREVNDRDFDVALQLVFESREAHDAYQTAQRHDEFIARNKDNWARVRVFDAELG